MNIKEYKPIFVIKMFDWDPIEIQANNIDALLDMLNDRSSSFVKISSELIVAKNQIKWVQKLTPSNDVEEYARSLPKWELKSLLFEIIRERKSKGLSTRTIKHLNDIAKTRRPDLF